MTMATTGLLIAILILSSGCDQNEVDRENQSQPTSTNEPVIVATRPPIPTLYPTATLRPSPSPTITRTPPATAIPATPVDFQQTSLELRYQIPALNLDRKLTGSVSGQLEVMDLFTGQSVVLRDQSGIILQIQRALPSFQLREAPDECPGCVLLAYELPLANESEQGWLQNDQLLASVENYTAVHLGPHFPPGTVLGLRRSATPYFAAHTVALTDEDLLWFWMATEGQVQEPTIALPLTSEALAALEAGTLTELQDIYAEACPQRTGVDYLYLSFEDLEKSIQLICPELSLPSSLLPTYLTLLALSEERVVKSDIPAPRPEIPTSSLVYYRPSAEMKLNIHYDGRVEISSTPGISHTGTISRSEVISLTNNFIATGDLASGVELFLKSELSPTLVVRGPSQLYSISWDDGPPEMLLPGIGRLEEIIDLVTNLAVIEN